MTEPAHGGPETESTEGHTRRPRPPGLARPGTGRRSPLPASSAEAGLAEKLGHLTALPILTTDPERRCLQANNAATAVFGFSVAEMIGGQLDAWVQDIHPPVCSTVGSDKLTTGTWRFRQGNSGDREISYRMMPLADGALCFVLSDNDVSRAYETLSTVPRDNPNPILRIGHEGTLLFANPAAQRCFQNLKLKIGEPAPTSFCAIAKKIRQDNTSRHEFTSDDRTFLFNGNESMKDLFVHLYGVEITERKQMQERHRETEARLRTALNSLIEGCQIIGFDWTYLFVNPAAARHGRLTLEDLLGRRMTDVYPGVENTPLFNSLRRAMQGRIACELENEFSYPDGSTAVFQLVVQPVPEGIFILCHDITDRRRLEEQILNVRDIEQQRIGSDLHDDVGQQLTAISLLNSLLQHELNARQIPLASQAGKIAGLITQVMTAIRRISHGLQPVSAEPGGLMSALEELASNAATVRTQFECPKPVMLEDAVCANHLFRIAQEAVQNALRHARPTNVTIRLRCDKEDLVLEVEDDGIGFNGDQPRKGLGLQTMKYRTRAIRGVLGFVQPNTGGTLVRCSAPLIAQRETTPPQHQFTLPHP